MKTPLSLGTLLNYSLHMVACSVFLIGGGHRIEAHEKKVPSHEKRQELRVPMGGEHKKLSGLNLEGVLAGIRVGKDYVDLQVRKNQVAGYQMMPDKRCTFLTVREALEHLHRIGARYFVFDVADTASGRVLSMKAVRVTSPQPETLRLEGVHEKDRTLLRELTKRLKGDEHRHPAVTMRLANYRKAPLHKKDSGSLMQGRLDYHIFIDEGLEAKRQGQEMVWTFAFKGVRLSQLHVGGEQVGMTAAQFIEAMRPWNKAGQQKGGVVQPSRHPNGSLIVFKKGKPVRIVMEFSNFAYDSKSKTLTAEATPLRTPSGEVQPPAELLAESPFKSKPSTSMFLDCGEIVEVVE